MPKMICSLGHAWGRLCLVSAPKPPTLPNSELVAGDKPASVQFSQINGQDRKELVYRAEKVISGTKLYGKCWPIIQRECGI